MTRKAKDPRKPTKCRSCKAEILWVEFEATGKRMPIDALPADDGNVTVTYRANTQQLFALVLRRDEDPPENRNLYTSHFVTCPDADKHRRI